MQVGVMEKNERAEEKKKRDRLSLPELK